MNIRIFSYSLFSLFFLSCSRDLDIDISSQPSKLVVESYLPVGDSLLVRINVSAPPNSNGSYDNEHIDNAIVTVKVDNQNLQLQYTSQPIANGGRFGPEFVHTFQGSYYYLPLSFHKVKPKTIYNLTVSYQGLAATATILTMEKTTILSAELFPIPHDVGDTTVGLRIHADYPVEDSYYNVLWYIRQPFKIQQQGLDTTINIVVKVFQTEYLHLSGQSQINEFDTKQKYKSISISDLSGFSSLTRISKLQHEFFQAINIQKDDYSLFTETTDIPTNIDGGYGIFTSMAYDTLTVNAVK